MQKKEIRKIAIYIIVILAIIRFFIVPQVNALKDKRELYNEVKETYQTRLKLLERSDNEEKQKKADFEMSQIYDIKTPYTEIQTDLLENILTMAEREGLALINYEMPDVSPSKELTDVSVIVRLRGKPQAFNNLLIALKEYEKKIKFKQFETFKQTDDNTFTLTIVAFRVER
ncbi:MAG: hypothetical protein N2738_07140 [Thermodesulfovibrionales bacterium]|nr:hypothetical protein [Thermodesulfovibrionales bacterium]